MSEPSLVQAGEIDIAQMIQDRAERLLKPLASAVAYHLLGDTRRLAEVLPQVEADLKERTSRRRPNGSKGAG